MIEDVLFKILQVGDFSVDNRAGISRTLHRISAVRNRKGTIIGLTCRVGRAISGSADLLRDLVQDGASLLLIGPPGVGKTTIIRLVVSVSVLFDKGGITGIVLSPFSFLFSCKLEFMHVKHSILNSYQISFLYSIELSRLFH